MARINLEVEDERRDKWHDYADEHWAGNLSALIRQAVEREMAGGGDPPEPAAADVDLGPVEERLDDMASSLSAMEARMESLAEDEDLDRIAGRLTEWLPTRKPGTSGWEDGLADIRAGTVPDELPTDDAELAELAWSGGTEGLADASGYPEPVVEDALTHLEREVLVVHSIEVDGSERYYREGTR